MKRAIATVCAALWLACVCWAQKPAQTVIQFQSGGVPAYTGTGFFVVNFASGCTAVNSAGVLNVTCTGGAGNPGGSSTQLEYNSGGTAFGGVTDWTTNGTTSIIAAAAGVLNMAAMSISNLSFPSCTANYFIAAPNGLAGSPTCRAIVAADIPTLNQSTTGNSGTATALAATPTQCSGGQFATGVAASGNANCATPSGSGNVSTSGTITAGQIALWASTTAIESLAMSGDCTMTSGAVITCTKTGGTSFGPLATLASGGTLSGYTWSGGTFSGTIAGTPTISGVWTFSSTQTLSTSGNAATATALGATPTQCTGSQFATGIAASGNANCATPSGSGNVSTSGSPAAGYFAQWVTGTTIGNGDCDYGVTTSSTVTCAATGGIVASAGPVKATPPSGDASMLALQGNTANQTIPTNQFAIGGFSITSATAYGVQFPNTAPSGGQCPSWPTPTSGWSQATWVSCSGGGDTITSPNSTLSVGGTSSNTTLDIASHAVTSAYLATQYSKGSCTIAWAGSGTASALQSGDDAVANNVCYNDSGVTRTITAVKCRNDNASNTTTVNPTMGSAGTGTSILSAAITCGSSYAYSATGTVSSASWTTGTGIDPAMSGTLTGTSVAMIVEYTF